MSAARGRCWGGGLLRCSIGHAGHQGALLGSCWGRSYLTLRGGVASIIRCCEANFRSCCFTEGMLNNSDQQQTKLNVVLFEVIQCISFMFSIVTSSPLLLRRPPHCSIGQCLHTVYFKPTFENCLTLQQITTYKLTTQKPYRNTCYTFL